MQLLLVEGSSLQAAVFKAGKAANCVAHSGAVSAILLTCNTLRFLQSLLEPYTVLTVLMFLDVMPCRGDKAEKAAQDVLGQKALDMLIRKGRVVDEELLMMLS